MSEHAPPTSDSTDSGSRISRKGVGSPTEKIAPQDVDRIRKLAGEGEEETDKFAPIDLSTDQAPTNGELFSGPPPIPGYDVVGELGRGGMGVVCKAWHVKNRRFVALKLISAGPEANNIQLRRFKAEAEIVAKLSHPNIIQIYEVGEHQGWPFISLEFCGGGSLAKKLGGTPMSPQAAAVLLTKLAEALAVAHAHRIIHRDLKPSNILLTAEGEPKVGDFGLAKQLETKTESVVGVTLTGAVMGTPSYMPPEQASGDANSAGPAADIYALGAILYECLTGRPPFRAPTVVETLDQVRNQLPVPPRQFDARIPIELETICLKCLQKKPANRYAVAAELAEDLRLFLAGEPIKARPTGSISKAILWIKKEPEAAGRLAGIIVALTALVMGTVYFFLVQ
ncbi:MAG: serine/threonine protein kinase [Planctomycetes bacterium]|nr:serine/threonine protein kinase [Planctomycetota bacterium]